MLQYCAFGTDKIYPGESLLAPALYRYIYCDAGVEHTGLKPDAWCAKNKMATKTVSLSLFFFFEGYILTFEYLPYRGA